MGVHNGERTLPATISSVLAQRGVALEFIVIDDGSTDDTWSILQQRATEDARLKPYRQPRGGLTKALIAGCARAKGEYVARQDAGDLSLPGRLRKQHDLLASEPRLSFVACQHRAVGPAGEILNALAPEDDGLKIIESLRNAPVSGMQVPRHGSVMFRRDAYERVGGYRADFYFAQDLDLWSRLIEAGDLAFIPEVLYQSCFTPGSISAVYRSQQLLLRELIREATLRRRRGQQENHVLARAAQIRPEDGMRGNSSNADANYFIASCLYSRRDPAATRYLRQTIAENPLHMKAWLKLLGGHWRAAMRS